MKPPTQGAAGILADIARLLESARDPAARVGRVLDSVRLLIDCDRCALVSTRELAGVPSLFVTPRTAPEAAAALRLELDRLLAALTPKADGQPGAAPPMLGSAHGAAHLAVPLVAADEVRGILFVQRRGRAYGEQDLEYLAIVGAQLGAYLANVLFRTLGAGHDRLKRILATAGDGIWVFDADGRTVLANARAGEFFGFDPETAAGRPAAELAPEALSFLGGEQVAALCRGDLARSEFTIYPGGVRERHLLVSSIALSPAADQPAGAVAVFTDLTQSRHAAQYARSLIEVSLDPLVTISPEGKITDVNEATVKVTGVPRDELVGTDFSGYFTEPAKAQEGYRQVFAEGTVVDYPLTIRHRDGRLTDVLYNASVYRDVHGRVLGVFAAARDVTESRRVLRAFTETKDFLDNVLQSSTRYSIIGKDLAHRILSWNEGARRNYGYRADEIIGEDSHFLHTPEDVASGAVARLYAEAYEKGLAEGEFTRVRKDGSRFMANVVVTRRNDAAGRPIGFLLVSNDISEKKQAEDLLRKQAALLQLAPVAVMVRDVESRITYWNRGAEELYGWTAEEAVGNVSHAFLRTEHPAPLAEIEDEVLRSSRWEGELVHRRRDGERVAVASRWALQQDAGGRPAGFLEIDIDMTERRRAEESVRQALREKETLLREIHHRVKNNLQVVSSLLDLQAQKITDAGLRELFRESQRRVKSMALVHEKMYQTKSLSAIDFRDYVTTIVNELSSYFGGAERRIATTIDVAPVSLNLDLAIPCALVINELLTNAYKHAFPRGARGEVHVGFRESGGACKLTVADDGAGMPAGFDWRRAPSLGYQLVTVLVKQLGGSIEVTTTSKGVRVEIAFERGGADHGEA